MYKYMLEHERSIMLKLESASEEERMHLQEYHKTQIEFLQHERIVHLVVTLAFAIFLIVSLISTMVYPVSTIYLLDLLLVIILSFYIVHYYRLENGVQRWYLLYNRLDKINSRQ